jgi:hypothetical protein
LLFTLNSTPQPSAAQSAKMTEVISIVGDSNVKCNLDSAKAANPSDHCLHQSHLIVAFNAVQLQSSLVSQNEHRWVVVLAALSNPITCFTFLGGDQLIIDVRLFVQNFVNLKFCQLDISST